MGLWSVGYGLCVVERIMLLAGLCSYRAVNSVGGSSFYVVVGCPGCLVAAGVLLIVSSFCNNVKAQQ